MTNKNLYVLYKNTVFKLLKYHKVSACQKNSYYIQVKAKSIREIPSIYLLDQDFRRYKKKRKNKEAMRRRQNFKSRLDIRFQLNPRIRALNEKCAGTFRLKRSPSQRTIITLPVYLSQKAVVF